MGVVEGELKRKPVLETQQWGGPQGRAPLPPPTPLSVFWGHGGRAERPGIAPVSQVHMLRHMYTTIFRDAEHRIAKGQVFRLIFPGVPT